MTSLRSIIARNKPHQSCQCQRVIYAQNTSSLIHHIAVATIIVRLFLFLPRAPSDRRPALAHDAPTNNHPHIRTSLLCHYPIRKHALYTDTLLLSCLTTINYFVPAGTPISTRCISPHFLLYIICSIVAHTCNREPNEPGIALLGKFVLPISSSRGPGRNITQYFSNNLRFP